MSTSRSARIWDRAACFSATTTSAVGRPSPLRRREGWSSFPGPSIGLSVMDKVALKIAPSEVHYRASKSRKQRVDGGAPKTLHQPSSFPLARLCRTTAGSAAEIKLPDMAIRHNLPYGIMRQLVKDCRIVGFGRRARRGADESFARRHLNGIRRGAIEGSAAAVADGCAGRGDEGHGPLDRRDDRCGRGIDDGRLIAVDLLGRLKCANSGHVRARLIKRVPGAYSLSAMLARIRSISPCSSAVSGASVSWMASFFRSPVNLNGT